MKKYPTQEQLAFLNMHNDLRREVTLPLQFCSVCKLYELRDYKEAHPFFDDYILVYNDGQIEDCGASSIEALSVLAPLDE